MTKVDALSARAHDSANEETVTLVDLQDRVVGRSEKLRAHREGLLHRAFSVLVFDAQDRILLQRRQVDKYHSGGLWSNTACGHPRPTESLAAAAGRRLYEEMGITCDLTHQFSFVYRAAFEQGLVEYEYDHVFFGRYNGDPTPDAEEVADWRWAAPIDVAFDLAERRHMYTYWFRILISHMASSEHSNLIVENSFSRSS